MASDAPVSAADLGQHTAEDDCWLSIHGKVYNVTNYLMDHPGGLDVMMEHAGKDATEDFEYYGHSDKARDQMKAFLVGDYEGGDPAPVAEVKNGVGTSNGISSKPKSLPLKIIQALLPLLLVVAAFVVKSFVDAPKK